MKHEIQTLDEYKKSQKREKYLILFLQIAFFAFFLGQWELTARLGLVNSFLVSYPSQIFSLFVEYVKTNEIWRHISISLIETLLGLVGGTLAGILIAIVLWWFPRLSKISDPFLVVLNALPKTALAPIIILWIGTGIKGIVFVAISLSIVVTILSAHNAFLHVNPEQMKMLQTFGANKWQLLWKLVLPSNIKNILNIIKINIGMSWVGVIVGEFLVSREGIGYLVVYGGQVFKLDLVMMGVFLLAILAMLMYAIMILLEKWVDHFMHRKRKRRKSN